VTDYPERDFVKWPLNSTDVIGSGPLTGKNWVATYVTPEIDLLTMNWALQEVTHEDMLKIATLNMFERGEDVEGVGYRSRYIGNYYYYIY